MEIVAKMREHSIPLPDEFELHYVVEKYVQDIDGDEPPIRFMRIRPYLNADEAKEAKESLPDGKEDSTDNRTTTIVTNDESTYEGGIPWVEEGSNKHQVVFDI